MSLLGLALKTTVTAGGAVLRRLPRAAGTALAGLVLYDTALPVAESTLGVDLPGDGTITTRLAERVGNQVGHSAGAASTAASVGGAQGALQVLGFDTSSPQTTALVQLGVLGMAGLFVLQAVRR